MEKAVEQGEPGVLERQDGWNGRCRLEGRLQGDGRPDLQAAGLPPRRLKLYPESKMGWPLKDLKFRELGLPIETFI